MIATVNNVTYSQTGASIYCSENARDYAMATLKVIG